MLASVPPLLPVLPPLLLDVALLDPPELDPEVAVPDEAPLDPPPDEAPFEPPPFEPPELLLLAAEASSPGTESPPNGLLVLDEQAET